MNALIDVKRALGDHFLALAIDPTDEVDAFINERLHRLGISRGFSGWVGIQSVAKLRAMLLLTREELREAAILTMQEGYSSPESAPRLY